jgi:hypothetical protein
MVNVPVLVIIEERLVKIKADKTTPAAILLMISSKADIVTEVAMSYHFS